MWRNFGCGEILNMEKLYMWRNVGFGEILYNIIYTEIPNCDAVSSAKEMLNNP